MVSYDRIARDIAFTLEVKSPKVFEGIFLNNGCLAMFGEKGRVKIVRGSNRFDERVRLGQNSNVDHRDKHAAVGTTFQNNVQTAYYGQAVCDGAVPVNLVEQDQNAGEYRIQSLADDALEEMMNTFPNKIAEAIMKATSTATDPVSIVEELQATAYGAQTRTTGGLARSSYPGTDPTAAWQTQYDATAADLSAAAGFATFEKFIYTCSSGGSSIKEMPDIGITRNGVLARISGNLDVLRRYTPNERMAALGFNNFQIGSLTLYSDVNVTNSGYCYLVNSNYGHIQVLAGPNTKQSGSVKTIGEGKASVPIQILEPVRVSDKLQYNILAYLVYNLTFGGLRNHGLKTGLTES